MTRSHSGKPFGLQQITYRVNDNSTQCANGLNLLYTQKWPNLALILFVATKQYTRKRVQTSPSSSISLCFFSSFNQKKTLEIGRVLLGDPLVSSKWRIVLNALVQCANALNLLYTQIYLIIYTGKMYFLSIFFHRNLYTRTYAKGHLYRRLCILTL